MDFLYLVGKYTNPSCPFMKELTTSILFYESLRSASGIASKAIFLLALF